MRRQYKICALLTACMLFVLQACGDAEHKQEFTNDVTPTISVVTLHEDKHPTITLPHGEMRELQIYALSEDLEDVEAVTALVSAEGDLTPEMIVEVVLEAMADEAYFIEVIGISVEKDRITVDFGKEAPPVMNTNHTVETAILDAIGQSLLDNLPDYGKVSYSIEGEAYRTKNIELALGESYIER